MEISDLPDMQQDFLTRMTESWARLASAWTDTIKGLHEDTDHNDYRGAVPGWMNPWAFQSIVSSPSTAGRFQEMIDSAARDLPELLTHGRDKRTIKDIRDRWLQSYRTLVGEMFGIPQESDAKRFLEQWRSFAGALSRAGSGFSGGLFPDFSAMISSMRSFFEPGSGSTGFDFWTPGYEKMFNLLFRFSGGPLTTGREDPFERALGAQTTFLKALPEFQEQIVSAADRGLEKVINRIASLGVEQLNPETFQEFYRVWITTHEEAMIRLFRSDTFSRFILDTIQRGIEARKEMERLVAAGISPWSIQSKGDFDAVNEEIRVLRDHIGKLEEEVRALKAEITRNRGASDNNRHHSEVLQQGLD